MTSLVNLLLPLTAITALVLLLQLALKKQLSASSRYYLWALIPLAILLHVLPNVPLPFAGLTEISGNLQHYLVKPSKQVVSEAPNWLLMLWLSTSVLVFSLIVASHIKQAFNQSIKPVADNSLVKLPFGLKLYQSNNAHSPMLMFNFPCKLVVPAAFFQQYSNEQQQLILAHEICHYRRGDLIWNLIALTLTCAFWFHPLIWLAYLGFRRDQELSCDQSVLARKQQSSRINYSKALMLTASMHSEAPMAALYFKFNGEKNMLFERIQMIKTNPKASKLGLAMLVTSCISALSFFALAGDHQQGYQKHNSVKPIMRVEPKYPINAAKQGVEGAVLLKFDIDSDGNTQNIEVVTAKPAYTFDKVAKTALAQWRYESSANGMKDQMVQLDFAMSENSAPIYLTETIKVTKH